MNLNIENLGTNLFGSFLWDLKIHFCVKSRFSRNTGSIANAAANIIGRRNKTRQNSLSVNFSDGNNGVNSKTSSDEFDVDPINGVMMNDGKYTVTHNKLLLLIWLLFIKY